MHCKLPIFAVVLHVSEDLPETTPVKLPVKTEIWRLNQQELLNFSTDMPWNPFKVLSSAIC